MIELLKQIRTAVGHLADLEGQDQGLALDMSQAMISDVIETGALGDLGAYVRRYCDVIDGPEDADAIVAAIVADAQ